MKKYDAKKMKWQISKKVRHANKLLNKIANVNNIKLINHFSAALDECSELFEKRNEVIHGRIYANYDRSDTLHSSRSNVQTRKINSSELYELANELNKLRLKLYRPVLLTRAIIEHLARKNKGKHYD